LDNVIGSKSAQSKKAAMGEKGARPHRVQGRVSPLLFSRISIRNC
jgi:hypothetical protein